MNIKKKKKTLAFIIVWLHSFVAAIQNEHRKGKICCFLRFSLSSCILFIHVVCAYDGSVVYVVPMEFYSRFEMIGIDKCPPTTDHTRHYNQIIINSRMKQSYQYLYGDVYYIAVLQLYSWTFLLQRKKMGLNFICSAPPGKPRILVVVVGLA